MIKDFFGKIDLGKKYPNYFNKKIFRGSMIIIVVLFVVAFILNDYSLSSAYISCSNKSLGGCENPLYSKDKSAPYCRSVPEICQKESIAPGETIGKNPSFLVKYFASITLLITVSAFVINHICWEKKK